MPAERADCMFILEPAYPIVSLDIGGTLIKICLILPCGDTMDIGSIIRRVISSATVSPVSLQLKITGQDYCVHLLHVPTNEIGNVLEFLLQIQFNAETIHVTGGGAYKYATLICQKLHTAISRVNEMKSIANGLLFAHTMLADKIIHTVQLDSQSYKFIPRGFPLNLPIILVNVGSGVSVLKLCNKDKLERITGTSLGGGTALGLSKLMFGIQSFEEMIQLAEQGSEDCDLTVGELIGPGQTDLPDNLLAASFGNLEHNMNPNTLTKENFARSAIRMISYNIGYIAYLVANQQKCHSVFFTGSYVNGVYITKRYIVEAFQYHENSNKTSDLKPTPYFVSIDAYIGVIGALVSSPDEHVCRNNDTSLEE